MKREYMSIKLFVKCCWWMCVLVVECCCGYCLRKWVWCCILF